MVNNYYSDKESRYPFKPVTIETVDSAVFDYFDKKIELNIYKDDVPYKVPVFFATGERWAVIRKSNFRDSHGTLILPVVSIRRLDILRDTEMGGMTSAQKHITISNVIHPKNSNLQNLIKARKDRGFVVPSEKPPIIETLTIPFPDFSTIQYEIVFWTQFTTQMNDLLEKVFYNYANVGGRVDSFVMPAEYDGKKPKGDSYYFVGFSEGNMVKESNEDNYAEQEKVQKYIYRINVPVYLILDNDDEALGYGYNDDGTKTYYKKQSVNKIKLTEEVITFEEFEKRFGKTFF